MYGGPSYEHAISLLSGYNIVQALKQTGVEVVLIGVNTDGQWYLQEESAYTASAADSKSLEIVARAENQITLLPGVGMQCRGSALGIDVVFPIIHGNYGEDGTLQALLDSMHIPYVGCGQLASAIGMHKGHAKSCWVQNGLPVVPYIMITAGNSSTAGTARSDDQQRAIDEFVAAHGFPLFVKPAGSGSSLGISRVDSADEIDAAIEQAASYDPCVLIEKGISGRELEVALLGGEGDAIRVTGAGEICTTANFYDYEEKYTDTPRTTFHIPAKLSSSLLENIQNIAIDAYRCIGARGMARVDFLVDTDEHIYLNEINTLPGFTDRSMYPVLWESAGVSIHQLVTTLLASAR